jgi:hypothetical protein
LIFFFFWSKQWTIEISPNSSGFFLCGGGRGGIQVELNIDFVQKKRDDAPFSPNDQQSVELFLQVIAVFFPP